MASFGPAVTVVLAHEGGLVNDEGGGGWTNFGISQVWLSGYLGHAVSEDAIRNMPRADAVMYYHNYWWLPTYEAIDSQEVATKIFDFAVNAGHRRAHHELQEALNSLGATLDVDGLLGPETLKAVNYYSDVKVLGSYAAQMIHFYRQLVGADPAKTVWLSTWLKRAAWPLERI